MAAKKATTRKYRQAKQAAKPAAKAAFPGKKQAGRKDPKIKISAEDKLAIDDMKSQAKADLGKNAYLSKSEYKAQQAAARERFRSEMRAEFGEYGGKKAGATDTEAPKRTPKAAKKAAAKPVSENAKKLNKTRTFVTAVETPSQTEKKPVKKAAAKKTAPKKAAVKSTKTFGEVSKAVADATKKPETKMSKSAANKAAWAKMTPEQRRNWNANKPGAKLTAVLDKSEKEIAQLKKDNPKQYAANEKAFKDEVKARTSSRPTDASLRAKENAYLDETKKRMAAKNKALANSAKGKTQTPQAEKAKATAKPEGKAPKVAKKSSRTVRAGKFVAKKFPLVGLGIEVGSVVKGSTVKDLKEINRLKAKLGDKPMSAKEGAATQISSLANLATMGAVGKTRRQRMNELNAKIKKEEAKRVKQNKALRYGKGGESLVPGTAAYKAGSKTRPVAGAAPKPSVGAGGSTTKYVVKKGDTLSGIAKNAGLTVAEVKAINPKLMNDPKYKKGSMIWSGTKVNIKKK